MTDNIELPDNAEDITPEDSVVPVYLIPLTDEEIAQREAENAEREAAETAKLEQEAAAESAKASALKKLAKLGLTQEEAKAVIGME